MWVCACADACICLSVQTSSFVCICVSTCALKSSVPESSSIYFHIMLLLCHSKGEVSPVCSNKRPCGKLLFRRDMLKECSFHIKKALLLLSASQLCSRWDQISLLVSLINYEGNNQDEKGLHLTVKICLLTIRQQAGPGCTWVLAETKTAWIDALLSKTRKTQILQNIFWITWAVICSHEKVSEVIWSSQVQLMRDGRNQRYTSSPKKYLLFSTEPDPYLPHLLV